MLQKNNLIKRNTTMKKKLNFLCALVILVVFLVIFKTGYDFGAGIYAGIKTVQDNKNLVKEQKKKGTPVLALQKGDFRLINLVPTKAMIQPDSILNEKTGQKIPVAYSQMIVQVNEKGNTLNMVIIGFLSFIGSICVIVALVYFIKLIISINKSTIFDWKNVKRLRIMGYALLISFFCITIPPLMDLYTVKQSVALENYMINPTFLDNIKDLFLALGCFIVAETFAIGLKLKEEQDLTI